MLEIPAENTSPSTSIDLNRSVSPHKALKSSPPQRCASQELCGLAEFVVIDVAITIDIQFLKQLQTV